MIHSWYWLLATLFCILPLGVLAVGPAAAPAALSPKKATLAALVDPVGITALEAVLPQL